MKYILCFLMVQASILAFSQDGGAREEARLLSKTRQLTIEGKRAGEGYYSMDGGKLTFQSEREPKNPFYQIYLMDLETGDTGRVSPGFGKATCSYFRPHQDAVIYASSHMDPDANKKMQEELAFRASGKQKRYAWDYDEHYDLFEYDLVTRTTRRLTSTLGYDAEASYSPDDVWVVFASNRHAYSEPLSPEDKEIFEHDKSYMIDLYKMRPDGTDVRRLTDSKGYDGGPFFSMDGKFICWRRFSPDGATAEIYVMNRDGADQRRLTKMGAMSWAPYFHPSGDYLIFTTNKHGFANFELYLVDVKGEQEPVRVTHTDGFDGLPVFRPDGNELSWTSNRGSSGNSQIFIARWNDLEARRLLGLAPKDAVPEFQITKTSTPISVDDLKLHVGRLTDESTEGRLTGTPGERKATDYVASVFKALNMTPAGDDGSFFQTFPFVAGVSLGKNNSLKIDGAAYTVDKDWRPLTFSKNGEFDPAEVVFAGYGIRAPEAEGIEAYDSFVHLDVKDKWILVFRYMPEDISDKMRQHLNRFSSLRFKAMLARDLGARGLLVVSGPRTKVKDELVKLAFDASLSGTSIPAISISRAAANALFKDSGKDLGALQEKLDKGEPMMGIALTGRKLSARVDIQQETREGRNVLARISSGGTAQGVVVIGGHVDHLGRGEGGGSLARENETGQIHFGADDNASGVAGMLEIAQFFADMRASGRMRLEHDLVFAAWSGEELGLLGSSYYVNNFGGQKDPETLRPHVAAYLNMDMIGRLDKNLVVQGMGSSPDWKGELERRNAPIGLPLVTQSDAYLPTDATSFYLKKVPILSMFTGSHEDYHSPRDTMDKLNYEGMRDIAKLTSLIALSLVRREDMPAYNEIPKPESQENRRGLRAYLGTIPDYAQGDVAGVKLSGVSKGGPSEKAGVKGGDVIVSLAGKKIENIYDYTYAIDAVKIGEETEIVVVRDGEKLTFKVVPGSRE